MQSESALSSRVVRALRDLGVPCRKIAASPYSARGISDIIGALPPEGIAFFIEMKTPQAYALPNHNMSEHQQAFLSEMRAAGAITGCCCSVQQVLEHLGL